MTSPNSTFTEMVTTTLRNRKKQLADNVSNHNALFKFLYDKGNYVKEDGGRSIVCELDYAENSTYQRYSGYEQLNIQASDVLSAAEYDWKQVAVNVTASGLELRQNSGKNGLIKLAKARMKNAERTFANNLSSDLYSDGTGDGGKQVGGITSIITTAGTGTVGGINSSNYSFWQNKSVDCTTASASNIQGFMNDLWLEVTRGTDQPDLVISDVNYYKFYWESLTALQRFTDDEKAGAGFNALRYAGKCKVIHDTTASGITANRMYFLNTDYLKLVVHKDADMEVVGEKSSVNQDAVVIPMIWQGNLTCSNRSLQGVVYQ